MSKNILKTILVILIIGFVISAFEIINLSALYKDQVDLAYTFHKVSGSNSKVEIEEIKKLDLELTKSIYLSKISTFVFGMLSLTIMIFWKRIVKRNACIS